MRSESHLLQCSVVALVWNCREWKCSAGPVHSALGAPACAITARANPDALQIGCGQAAQTASSGLGPIPLKSSERAHITFTCYSIL